MQTKTRVLGIDSLNDEVYRMELARPKGFSALPGQFIQMKVDGEAYPLLRRPISLFALTETSIVLYIKRAGLLTRHLADLPTGTMIDFIGPLGTHFESDDMQGRTPVLVGGGIGIAPVAFLAKQLDDEGLLYHSVLGFRNVPYGLESFRQDTLTLHVEREQPGFVTDVLEAMLKKDKAVYLFACGPTVMLKAVKRLAKTFGVPAQLSLEERMACGVGACVGCTVRCTDGLDITYRRVCKEGPVFNAAEVLWDE